MKTLKLIALVVMILSMNFIYTQEKVQKVKIYKTWIILNDESKIHGILYQLKDSSILVTNIKTEESQEIDIKDIQKIKIRRKNSIGRGAVIGGVSGLVVGGIVGYMNGDDPDGISLFKMSAEEKAVSTGVGFLPIGAGVGILVGTIKKKFDINGNISNYNKNIQQLRKYAIKKRDQISLNNN